MWLIVSILLGIALCIVVGYLFLLKRELRNQQQALQEIHPLQTNRQLHQELGDNDLRKLLLQINQLLADIRQKEGVLQQQKKKLQQEVTNISHDLKTPLTSAIGYLDLLRSSDLEHRSAFQIREDLTQIEQRLFKLNQLVIDFFEFSKAQSRSVELQALNALPLLEQSMISLYDDFQQSQRNIQLEQLATSPLIVLANERMLSRIFDNLLGNSYQHGVGDVVIHVQETENEAIFQFTNAYQGAELDSSAIFEEFYTADISRTKGNSGLGLAIVKEFVAQMDGQLTATTKQQQLVITIRLPKSHNK